MAAFNKLDNLRHQTCSAVIKFHKNPNTPSLRFKPVAGMTGIFTFRVNDNFRVMVRVVEEETRTYYLLTDVGKHDLYDRL
jgi:hypothetical protein